MRYSLGGNVNSADNDWGIYPFSNKDITSSVYDADKLLRLSENAAFGVLAI